MDIDMSLEKYSHKLNGVKLSKKEDLIAKITPDLIKNDLIVIYGHSDDIVEVEGLVSDEEDCSEGSDFCVTPGTETSIFEFLCLKVFWYGKIDEEILTEEENFLNIPFSYEIDNDLNYRTFDIIENGEVYCVGMVIHIPPYIKDKILSE